MNKNAILHICLLDKFIPPFIEFMEQQFEFEQHCFVLIGEIDKYPVRLRPNVLHINLARRTHYLLLLIRMHLAGKVILHSIFERNVVRMLFNFPWLLRKCYWLIWGGDLYHFLFRTNSLSEDRFEKIRAFVIRNMGHLATYVKGDFELAQKWYGARGIYHECLMYPSNLYQEYNLPPKKWGAINILVGNSAFQNNNHLEVFERLVRYKNENVIIFCPLSYGDMEYAKWVAEKGNELFGDKFVPLMEFMAIESYLGLLAQIDIAIFAHKRQQAMGNTINLLGMGKKVYMRSDVTPWKMFAEMGVKVFDVCRLDLVLLNADERKNNHDRIMQYFSENKLVEQWQNIFEVSV